MKNVTRKSNAAPMSADAYAGFLKLWLTPASRTPALQDDVEAYIRYASVREPLSDTVRRAIRQPTNRAA